MPINNMQADYQTKMPATLWDPVHTEYRVRKFPGTENSRITIGHEWRGEPEVVRHLKDPLDHIKEYIRDYNVTKELMSSQSTEDFGFKLPETKRFNKHTSCNENHYIYPTSRRFADLPPQVGVYGSTEARSAYKVPTTPSRLVTDKDQYKHPAFLSQDPAPTEPSWHKELPPLDTTHEGFEKYLDPYLTTNRLHHRPYTADQLEKLPYANNVVTYYTFSDTPMVRTPKRVPEDWRLPLKLPQSMYDREKFKQDAREIRTHNRLKWIPGSFRTEVRDNYTELTSKSDSRIYKLEEDVRSFYQRNIANLSTNTAQEHSAILQGYRTEGSTSGSNKPICTILDQFPEKNKKLEIRENLIRHSGQFY